MVRSGGKSKRAARRNVRKARRSLNYRNVQGGRAIATPEKKEPGAVTGTGLSVSHPVLADRPAITR
ncbi:hypothetical protein GCM10007904_37350 [Oharaeibacter diazotrophicus]|nr:hypothetical protein GCM10007904_37350 [Oharaeibacter diazotrophicus]